MVDCLSVSMHVTRTRRQPRSSISLVARGKGSNKLQEFVYDVFPPGFFPECFEQKQTRTSLMLPHGDIARQG
jgi:hypothetical protein